MLKQGTPVVAVKRIVGDREVVEVGTGGCIDVYLDNDFYSVDWDTGERAFSLSATPDEFELTS